MDQAGELVSATFPIVTLPAAVAVPALIAARGDQASWRYVDFFTANIRNLNTRRAYARAASDFLGWCEARGLALLTIQPSHVSTWVEQQSRAGRIHPVKATD